MIPTTNVMMGVGEYGKKHVVGGLKKTQNVEERTEREQW